MRNRLPNALSLSRVVMAIAVLALSLVPTTVTYVVSISVVGLALLSDALDGYLARRWNVQSDLGYVLDTMGDRAMHLALILMIVARYQIHPLVAWLLIFRDIGIYGIRVLTRDWLQRSKDMRALSLTHSLTLRAWIVLFLVRDGLRVFTGADVLDTTLFAVSHSILLSASILAAYYSLYRASTWLMDNDQPAVAPPSA